MKKITTLAVMLIVSISAMAQAISQEQAIAKAQQFLTSSKGMHKAKGTATNLKLIRQQEILANTIGDQMYLYNVGDGNGFVIVSGDERTPAILGYADTGSINPQNMPENMRAWLEGYAKQISLLGDNAVMMKAVPTHPAVAPIVTTKWDQGAPFNNLCPIVEIELKTEQGIKHVTERTVTGCVATSLAQIINVVRPSKVNAIPAYTTRSHGITMDALPAKSFAWDGSDNDLASIMRYCGQAVQMDYNINANGGSGATDYDAFEGLKKFLNISSLSCDMHQRVSYTSEEWDNVIYKDISSHRPIYISGSNAHGGHAFVCDGYDGNGKYHINWGWGGMSDGYFVINNLTPKVQGIGGSSGGYNDDCFVITGIKEKAATEDCIFTVSIREPSTISETSFTRASETDNFNFALSCQIKNSNNWETQFDFTYALYDGDQQKQISSDILEIDLQKYYYNTYNSKTFSLGENLPDGTYRLVPISRQTGTTVWTFAQNHRAGEFVVEISGNTATIISEPAANDNPSYVFTNISADGNHVAGVKQELTMTVENTGNCNSTTYYLGCEVSEGLYVLSSVTLDINPGEIQTVTTKFAINYTGTYALKLYKKTGVNKYQLVKDLGINYEIIPEQLCPINIKIEPTSEYVVKNGVYYFHTPNINFTYKLTNENSTPYHSYVYLWFGIPNSDGTVSLTTSSTYSTPADVEKNSTADVEYNFTIPEQDVEYIMVGSYVSGRNGQDVNLDYDIKNRISVIYDPTTTGITTPVSPSQSAQGIYTLDGRRVNASAPLHGIYIKDGKKYVVK